MLCFTGALVSLVWGRLCFGISFGIEIGNQIILLNFMMNVFISTHSRSMTHWSHAEMTWRSFDSVNKYFQLIFARSIFSAPFDHFKILMYMSKNRSLNQFESDAIFGFFYPYHSRLSGLVYRKKYYPTLPNGRTNRRSVFRNCLLSKTWTSTCGFACSSR